MNFALYNAALGAAGATATLTATSTEQDVVNAFNNALNAANTKVTELTNLLTAASDEKVTTLVSAAVLSGKIVASERDSFEKLARADYTNTAKILNGMAAKPSALNSIQLEATLEGTDTGTDPRAGWDFAKWRKEDPAGLEKLQASDPKLVDALRSKYLSQRTKN